METQAQPIEPTTSFYNRPKVQVETISVGPGVSMGFERVTHPEIGIGGAYGTWGESFSNEALTRLIEERIGQPLKDDEKINLTDLGFDFRQHLPLLTKEQHIVLEVQVGARFLREAAHANGWETSEVQAVLIGASSPATEDYTERIAKEAGIPSANTVKDVEYGQNTELPSMQAIAKALGLKLELVEA